LVPIDKGASFGIAKVPNVMGKWKPHGLPGFVRSENSAPKLYPVSSMPKPEGMGSELKKDSDAWLETQQQDLERQRDRGGPVLPLIDTKCGKERVLISKGASSKGSASPSDTGDPSPRFSRASSMKSSCASDPDSGRRLGSIRDGKLYSRQNSGEASNGNAIEDAAAPLPNTIPDSESADAKDKQDSKNSAGKASLTGVSKYTAEGPSSSSKKDIPKSNKSECTTSTPPASDARVSSKDSMSTQKDDANKLSPGKPKEEAQEEEKDTTKEEPKEKVDEKASINPATSSCAQAASDLATEDKDVRDEWDFGDEFAGGTSAIVFHVTSKGESASSSSNPSCVCKCSRPGKQSELAKEAKFLKHVGKHPHVVEFMGFYHSEEHGVALVLENLHGGEILQLVEQPCSEMHVRIIAVQVCQAIGFIHSRGVVHRDIKAENVVLSGKGGEVKVVDFGLAGFEEDDEAMMTRCGSPGYIAPEVIDGERCSFSADIFGLGVVVYLLIAGRLPFRGKNPHDVLRRNLRCNVKFEDDIWYGLGECKSFVSTLLAKDPENRPLAADVWRHSWFACLLQPGASGSGEASAEKKD
jgi:hypothetical protein